MIVKTPMKQPARLARWAVLTLALTGAAALSTGCAITAQVPAEVAQITASQKPVELKDVPFFAQTEHYCGPSALAMAINYRGGKTNPDQLAPMLVVPDRKGSLQLEMLSAPRRQNFLGLEIDPKPAALLDALNARYPVVVLLNMSLNIAPQWHYAVVVGYDPARDEVLMRSGTEQRQALPMATFLKLWGRSRYWGMVVSKAGEPVPEFISAQSYLNAAVGLERGQHEQSLAVYQLGAERWPQEPYFYFGAGNVLYQKKAYQDAEAQFSKAVSIYPSLADGWNNLAETLMQLGRPQEARAAVNKAISLGGPRLAAYEDTANRLDGKNTAKP